MIFRCLLAIQIAVALSVACYTVSKRAEVWRCGHELALLRKAKAQLLEKHRFLQVRLTQVRMPGKLQERARMVRLALTRPPETSTAVAFAALREAQGNGELQFALSSVPPAHTRRY